LTKNRSNCVKLLNRVVLRWKFGKNEKNPNRWRNRLYR
jgi:hypothetical protein